MIKRLKAYLTSEPVKAWYKQYERHISSIALLSAFIFDNWRLTRIDLAYDNVLLIFYLIVSGATIIILNLHEDGRIRKESQTLRFWMLIAMQFTFGGLFSAFFVFYFRSGSLATSWPFILFLIVLVIGNEFFKERYFRLWFQVGTLFIALFSFDIFFVPIVVGQIGASVFLLSGLISLAIMSGFLYLLAHYVPNRMREARLVIIVTVAGIFFGINGLYFTNIIPPIPLSLKDAGIYHSITRADDGSYIVAYEDQPWYDALLHGQILHINPGTPAYAYSAVYSPASIDTRIMHEWQYWSDAKGAWVTSDRIRFPIGGGRDGGYRGYSVKSSLTPGEWRVNIETERGQLIDRIKFTVAAADWSEALKVETK